MRNLKFSWTYLIAAALLIAVAYLASLALFPEWAQSVRLLALLAVAVVLGVFAFLANFRQVLEPAEAANPPASVGGDVVAGDKVAGDNIAGDKTVDQHAGGDIVGGDKVTTQTAARDIIIAQTVQKIEAAQAGVLGLHQLPSPPADFTGREAELAELRKAVSDADHGGGAAISGLRGMGGVGKTALGLVLAHELATRYPDAQFFLDLQGTRDQPLTPAAAMAHVIRAYKPLEKLPDDAAQLAAAYRSLLHDQKALLFFDDAADRAQVEPLIPPPGCFMLVTTRLHFVLPGLQALDLDQLSPEEAAALLLKICPRIGEHAGQLADRCGCLPLALRLAASALAERPNLGVVVYLRFLEAEQGRLKVLDRVEASLALSYNLLSPELQGLWRLLAVFPGDFEAGAAAAVWSLDADPASERLGDLLRYSLLDFDPESNRYRLHDLARDFAGLRLSDADGALAHRRHAEHYRDVLAAVNELYLKGGENVLRGLALFDMERANIVAGQAWAAAHAGQDDLAARLVSDYSGAYMLDLRQHPQERIAWLEAALTAVRLMKDLSAEEAHLGNLGIAYKNLGEPRRAIECYGQSLVIAREIGDRRGEATSLVNLGLAYADLGEPRRAIDYLEQALVIAKEIGDPRGEGAALGNLGIAHKNLGELDRAIEYYKQHLQIAREIGDRRGQGNALGNLGNAYSALGEPRRAIEYYEQQLAITREIGDHRGEGNALNNAGLAYAELGETRRAIENYEHSLAIKREIGDRRGQGNALGNLGSAYLNLGEPRRAIEYYEQQLAIAREIGDRQGESNSIWNLGLVYEQQGDLEKALALMPFRVDYERELGHPDAEKHAARVEAIRKRLAGG